MRSSVDDDGDGHSHRAWFFHSRALPDATTDETISLTAVLFARIASRRIPPRARERRDRKPQVNEDASVAAVRELYEEVGMRVGETSGLELVRSLPCEPSRLFCYPAGGWLAEQGLAGQRLEFTLFHLATTEDPSGFVNLSGLEGEHAEFSRVRWATMAEAVEAVWGPKRLPYERCAELAAPIIEAHLGRS